MTRDHRVGMGWGSLAVLGLWGVLGAGCGPTYQVNETTIVHHPADTAQAENPHGGDQANEADRSGGAAGQVHNGVLDLGVLTIQVPEDWEQKPNPNRMRLATFVLPPAAGDHQAAELSITQVGGSVDANLKRWEGQFAPASGKTVADAAEVTVERVGGLEVTLIDLTGTYHKPVGPVMMSGKTEDVPNFRLLGAIVATPGQPMFFKIVGPEKTVGAHKEEFLRAIRSIKPAG